MNITALRAVLNRMKPLIGRFEASLSLYGSEIALVANALEMALAPPFLVKSGTYSEEVMGEMLKAGPGSMVYAPDPESDLEDVLDSYRLAGRLCGVQVVAIDEVVCWTGDICEDLVTPRTLPWGRRKFPAFYHVSRGANAIDDAAKWLRKQLDAPGRTIRYEVGSVGGTASGGNGR